MTESKKAFNKSTATLIELNRELKRLANRKCLAKNKTEKAKYDKEYKALAQFKKDKFKTSKKAYIDYTQSDINDINDLDIIKKALASLSSTKTNYPDRTDQCLNQMSLFIKRRDELKDKIEYERLKAKFNQD